jgi:hypothetical protein
VRGIRSRDRSVSSAQLGPNPRRRPQPREPRRRLRRAPSSFLWMSFCERWQTAARWEGTQRPFAKVTRRRGSLRELAGYLFGERRWRTALCMSAVHWGEPANDDGSQDFAPDRVSLTRGGFGSGTCPIRISFPLTIVVPSCLGMPALEGSRVFSNLSTIAGTRVSRASARPFVTLI